MPLPAFHEEPAGTPAREGQQEANPYPTISEQRLALQYSVSKLLLQSDQVEEVGPVLLGAICQAFDSQLGQWWENTGDELRLRAVWHEDDEALRACCQAMRGATILRRDCEFWPVLERDQALVLNDAKLLSQTVPGLDKAPGLTRGLIVPIPRRAGLLCMLTSSSETLRQPDPGLLEAVESIARQLSQYIGRVVAEKALAEAAAKSLASDDAPIDHTVIRGRLPVSRTVRIGAAVLDESIHGLRGPAGDVVLTRLEWLLLLYLLENRGRVLTRSEILESVWGSAYSQDSSLLHDTISRLRQRLRAAGVSPDPIRTVYGVGYKLEPRE